MTPHEKLLRYLDNPDLEGEDFAQHYSKLLKIYSKLLKIARLQAEALEFYANETNYVGVMPPGSETGFYQVVDEDRGNKARAAQETAAAVIGGKDEI